MTVKHTYSYVKNIIESFGNKLINDGYIDCKSDIIILFRCGHNHTTTYSRFLSKRNKDLCPECSLTYSNEIKGKEAKNANIFLTKYCSFSERFAQSLISPVKSISSAVQNAA